METIESFNTWRGLISLLILVLAFFWLLKLISYVFERYGRKNISKKRAVTFLKKSLLVYKPIAMLILLLGFVSINYITHSVLLVFITVFGFNYIKNYLSGIFFCVNPLVNKEAIITIGNFKGEIKSLQTFGLIINTEYGERFINYIEIEKLGFAVTSTVNTKLRQTLFLRSHLSQNQILNFLFDNPIIDFHQKPTLKYGENYQEHKLQYTLENGASNEDLIAFLHEKNIETSTTNNFN